MADYYLLTGGGLLFFLYALTFGNGLAFSVRSHRLEETREAYERIIRKYLEPNDCLPSLTFQGLARRSNRELLVRQLKQLSAVLQGVECRILLWIFRSNRLQKHLYEECRSVNPARRARALAAYGDIVPQTGFRDTLNRHMGSRNREVRMYALLAAGNHDPENFIPLLRNYPHPLSARDYTNIHTFLLRHPAAAQQAILLLDSRNDSVRRLGHKLLRLYGTGKRNPQKAEVKQTV